jgi:hypothetical protein
MKTAALLVAALVLSGGCNHESEENAKDEALTLDSQTSNLVAGSYRRGKVTLRVSSETTFGRGRLQLTRGDGGELITVSNDGPEVTMSVMGRLTAGHDATQSATAMVAKGDQDAFRALIKTPELALLPQLSAALTRAGVAGSDYPAAEPIHDLAAHAKRMIDAAASAVERRDQAFRGCVRQVCLPEETFNEKTCQCELPDNPADRGEAAPGCNPRQYTDLRSDPCHDDCRGMCGPNCGGGKSCWEFVCGDCRYHEGCAIHDDMCTACYDSYGVAWAACGICLTPIAAFVAKIGC